MRRFARSHFGCCCQHKDMWRSAQTKNMRSPYTIREEYWLWLWDFRNIILKCNKFIISVQQICRLRIKLKLKFK